MGAGPRRDDRLVIAEAARDAGIITTERDDVGGRRVKFIEPYAAALDLFARPGTRMAGLLVPAPPAPRSTSRGSHPRTTVDALPRPRPGSCPTTRRPPSTSGVGS